MFKGQNVADKRDCVNFKAIMTIWPVQKQTQYKTNHAEQDVTLDHTSTHGRAFPASRGCCGPPCGASVWPPTPSSPPWPRTDAASPGTRTTATPGMTGHAPTSTSPRSGPGKQ